MRSSVVLVLALSAVTACSAGGDEGKRIPGSGGAGGLGGGGAGGGFDLGGGGGTSVSPINLANVCDPCQNFPADPIFDDGVSTDAPSQFSGSPSGSGPCIAEPQEGTLLPANWLRPRFRVTGASGLKQIRLSAERETNDLVAYTNADTWVMPDEIWKGIAANVFEEDITVTITAAGGGSSTSSFRIAPVNAGGSMVYWAAEGIEPGDTSWLVGFGVGEEGTVEALRIGQVEGTILGDSPQPKRAEFGVAEGKVRCIGCHTSTPDGDAVAFNDHWPWNVKVSSVREEDTGARPEWMTDGGEAMLQAPWLGMTTFSKGDWANGARRVVTSFGQDPNTPYWGQSFNNTGRDALVWMDLATTQSFGTTGQEINEAFNAQQGTAWDVIARNGDANGAVAPSWSNDGSSIVYTSSPATLDGHVGDDSDSDLYIVPFNGGAGGDAQPLSGASEAGVAEYYPSFSADDRFIAFNRLTDTSGKIFYRPDGEVYVIRTEGGDPIRLSANDPPSCTGESSPGVLNSWPKWSPGVQTQLGRSYYWLIFSSARDRLFELPRNQYSPPDTTASQLYMTAIVVEGDAVETYPGVYLWNQTTNTSNLTPAWDEFQIPPAVIR